MPPVGRAGVDMSSGHDLCAPMIIMGGVSTVLVNNSPCMTIGDTHLPHACPSHKLPHSGTVSQGSGTVMAGNKAVARVTDTITCQAPECVTSGSGNVIAGG